MKHLNIKKNMDEQLDLTEHTSPPLLNTSVILYTKLKQEDA